MKVDRGFLNVMILSWGFMLVLTAFKTICNIEKNVLSSVADDDPSFTGNGYMSLCIINASFALFNWFAPSFISMTGPRTSIVAGSLCFVFFVASFFWIRTDLLYIASAVVGLGAALIWTGQGNYMTLNSTERTISRNSGLFWTIYQSSRFVGNIFVSLAFNESEITKESRNLVFTVLTCAALAGSLLLLTMQKPPQLASSESSQNVNTVENEAPAKKPAPSAFSALSNAFGLFITPRMLMLSAAFVYSGLVLTFFNVYSSSIGFTKAMGDGRKSLLGIAGLTVGLGGVIGGSVFGVLASKFLGSRARLIIVAFGTTLHVYAYAMVKLNLPDNAPFGETDDTGLISASPALAISGCLALGIGDACFNTQLFAFLGTAYSKNSAAAFALLHFCQSAASAVSYFYASYFGLNIQVSILCFWLVLGAVAFSSVDVKYRREKKLEVEEFDKHEMYSSSVKNDEF